MKKRIKIIVATLVALLSILSSIMYSFSMLKNEAIDSYIKISQLNAKAFSKELNQDISNIEQSILNLSSIIEKNNDSKINLHLEKILRNYPQIRSINILKDEKILFSSNEHNIDLFIKNQNFFPTAIFDISLLQVSTPWIGRDFISGNSVYLNDEEINNHDLSFIPLLKKIKVANIEYEVIVNLNSEYFSNRFILNMNTEDIIFEIIRLDGILLMSTRESNKLGKKIPKNNLLDRALEKNQATGIDNIEDVKYIVTYILTEDYPLALGVKLDYEKSLLNWNKKQYNFFVVTSMIIVLCIIIAFILFYLYNKKIEQEIKLQKKEVQSQQKFKLLFQDSHFLASVIKSNGKIEEMNNRALSFLGETNSSIKEKAFWDLDCWKDQTQVKSMIENFTNRKYQGQLAIKNKENKERIIDFTLSSLTTEEENLLVVIGIDVTQKKEKEAKLKQAYTVFNNTRDGIMITDKATNILDINKAFEKITGYYKSEVINRKTNVLKSSVHSKEFYKKMWAKLEKNGFWEGEITNKNKKGENFTEWLTINTIYDKNKEVINYIGVFSDITEQKLKEKLLKEKDLTLYQQSKMAAMGEMIGNIAHQWRQPLSVVSSAATGILLEREMGVSTEASEESSLKAINKSAQYLSQTIDDFRNFLKLEKEVKLFNISKAIGDAINLSNIKSKTTEIDLVLNLDEKLEVYGIKNEFIQVLINILNNAKDALKGKENKIILIETKKSDNNIYIKTQDNAGGISPEIIERIFEPYFTTKHQSQGTGIGLYMSLEIIKNHMNGRLDVKNESFFYNNRKLFGANFLITLPIK